MLFLKACIPLRPDLNVECVLMFRDGADPARRSPPHRDCIRSLIDASPLVADSYAQTRIRSRNLARPEEVA